MDTNRWSSGGGPRRWLGSAPRCCIGGKRWQWVARASVAAPADFPLGSSRQDPRHSGAGNGSGEWALAHSPLQATSSSTNWATNSGY